MTEPKHFSLVKPTLDTPFHIDFDWWKQSESSWRIFLLGYLCADHQAAFGDSDENMVVDWVDPQTAEVRLVDGLQHVLITHCAKQPEFVPAAAPMVDLVFRVLLANGNAPMTARELGESIHRPPETILRTLAGVTVYKGIRPIQK